MEQVTVAAQLGWTISDDAEEAHALLCASDALNASPELPAPVRNFERTRSCVQARSVHVLRCGSDAIATFTLTWDAPFDAQQTGFPKARKPAYLSRLAVHPQWVEKGTIVGVAALRKAIELASADGADVLRSEANPDLTRVVALLELLGFTRFESRVSEDGRRRVYLQKTLP